MIWSEKAQELEIRYLTRWTDGNYNYSGGIKIEVQPGVQQGRPFRGRPNPLRYGTEFGIEFGQLYTYSKEGRLLKEKWLPTQAFSQTIKESPILRRPKPVPLPIVPKRILQPQPVVPK